MITKSPIEKSPKYYEALGSVPEGIQSPLDLYRMRRVAKWLYGNSVLDIGCGSAVLLNIIKGKYQIAGIEVNKKRVDDCNQILGQYAVKLGNIDKRLDFESESFDSVVCLEVLEHLVDPESTLAELVRISRKRIIITVPFNEKLKRIVCIHCANYTPYPAHLHSFNRESIKSIISPEVRIVKMELIGNKGLRLFPFLSPVVFKAPFFIGSLIDRLANRLLPKANWMMVILDKTDSGDKDR